jgi:mannose-6-phosphate isomerase
MFVGIANTPRDYAWGSRDDIANLLGRTPSGGPEAEYWLGTHPGSPAMVEGGQGFADGTSLASLATLPFIMKVLAAETSLSLQAHPSIAQARAGFARENAEGIPLVAPDRNYKDELYKPEMIYAVDDGFQALCGFRPAAETRALLAGLGSDPLVQAFSDRLVDDASLRGVFEWLLTAGNDVSALRERVLELAPAVRHPEFATVVTLSKQFPGDVGILISLLLNLVTLRAGEAVFLPSGNIHAYQHGLGIEVLAASDNVLRGGLTPKYVDVPELLSVLDFRPLPVPWLRPSTPSAGVEIFAPDVPDFELVVVSPAGGSAVIAPGADSIALCTEGSLVVSGASGNHAIPRGGAVFITADEGELTFTGGGTAYLATSNESVKA